jgi:hypothetical protein
MAADRQRLDDGTPIPHAFLMPRARKVGVWLDGFEDLGLWAWRCAACGTVGHGGTQPEAVERGLDHLSGGCRRPWMRAV